MRTILRPEPMTLTKPQNDSSVREKFNQKFTMPPRPAGEMPQVPQYLDELSDAELMSLYGEFMAWVSYSKAELVEAEINEERQANNCRIVEAKCLIGQWSDTAKGDTVTLAKARRDVDPEVIEQQEEHLNSRAYRKMVDAVFERCERGAQVLSRELSRRISIAPQERRQARYNP
jgi:hypothetical protein